jgi:predicted DNA-binding transcriptional regulator AlpA
MSNNNTHPAPRLLRITDVLAPIGPVPVSRSTWWEGVRTGRYPKPIKLGPKITVWRSDEIDQIVLNGISNNAAIS